MNLSLSSKVTWLLVAVLGLSLLTVGSYAVREQEGLAQDLLREWVSQCTNRYLDILGHSLADSDFDRVIKTGKALVAGMPVSYCEINTKYGDVAFREGFSQQDPVASFVWPVPYYDAEGLATTVGRLKLVLSPGPMTVAVSRIGQTISLAGVGILLLGLLLGGLAIRSMIDQPLKQLVTGLDRVIHRGDLTHRISVDRQDEMGVLANAINTLTGELRGLIVKNKVLAQSVDHECQQCESIGSEENNVLSETLGRMKNHIEQYGGKFWIESELGHKQIFHFTLPGEGMESCKDVEKGVCK